MTLQPQVTRDLALELVEPRFHPGPEYWDSARNWQGIPGIERTKSGRLWAAWYTGGRAEDENNHAVLVTSNDDGETWSRPILAIDPPADIRASDPVLWIDPRDRLWLFWMQTRHCGVTFDGRGGVWAVRLDNPDDPDGAWTPPRRIANGIMMNKPTVLASGDWLLPTAIWSHRAPYELSIPEEAFSNVAISRDQGETFELIGSAAVPKRGPDEHMIVERRDGSLWMLVRRLDGIGEAVSRDGGKTWTASPDVVIGGPGSRFHIRRLRSGRLLLINHRDSTRRDHLTASLSEDDGATWTHHLLLDARDHVSYPDATEAPDGTIWIVHDRERIGTGEILLRRISEDDIINGRKLDPPKIISQVQRPHIGTRREPLLDEFLADQLDNVAFKLHQPVPRDVALVTDKPWEGKMSTYITVFADTDRYRMYYSGYDLDLAGGVVKDVGIGQPHPMWVCMAESEDGLHWTRPALGLIEHEGATANNILWRGAGPDQCGVHGFAPFKDPNPDADPRHLYKAVGGTLHATKGDLYVMGSPDGIHWSLIQDEPILKQREHGVFDSQNLAFWDVERGEYRLYFRDYVNRGMPEKQRTIKTARSNDFIHWTDIEPLVYPGAPREQLYTNQVQPYCRAPHIFIGFPLRYVERRWSPSIEALPELEHRRFRSALQERFGTAVTDGLFMSSRDGKTFRRWDEAFIRPGPQLEGNWAYGDNSQCWGMIETPAALEGAPPELSFFAREGTWRGDGIRIRRYSIRTDGFVSINAPRAGGQLSLKPLRFKGSTLRLNVATSAAGSIRVQLEDFEGRPLEGYALEDCHEIVGDEIDRVVRWKHGSDVSPHAGQLVRVRFAMTDADLFSFRFVRAEPG